MKTAYLQIIRICNQDCIFCAQPQNGRILTLKDIFRQLLFYKKNWIKQVIITWWEPTLHKDFVSIVRLTHSFGFFTTIQTNWNQLEDGKIVRNLQGLQNISFIISLHSHIAAIHDAIKNSKWSFIKTVRWILVTHQILPQIQIRIAIALNIYNIPYLDKTIKYYLNEFPFVSWYILNNLDAYNIQKKFYKIILPLSSFQEEAFRHALQLVVENQKSLNIERIPLCYLEGYEMFSDWLEYILGWDEKYVHFLQDDRESKFIDKSVRTPATAYGKLCVECDLKSLCWWIPKLWELYDETELIPKKISSDKIERIISTFKLLNNVN